MSLGYGLVLVVHVLVALFLIGVILLQGGRGGLGEAMGGAAAQSLFGGGVNTVMTRVTAVCAALFMATCLSLAMLSTASGRSVIDRLPSSTKGLPFTLPGAPEPASVPTKPAASVPSSSHEAPPAPVVPPAAPTASAPSPLTASESPSAQPVPASTTP